jgi:peptide/nickel transport system ATP-binding protein
MSEPLLAVEDLRVAFSTEGGLVHAVDGVSFGLNAGEILAVVGESGCGKSVTALTLMGLTRGANTRLGGEARLGDVDLLRAPESELRRIRGNEVAMVFQDPMTSLNPVQRIGRQIEEQIEAHGVARGAAARGHAIEMLGRAGIPRPRELAEAYPHQLSGGMRQRTMIALALSCSPRVLLADEPTTALDVTIQAQILARIRELRDETGAAIMLVTHDLGVVAEIADRVAVMYAGRIVEEGRLDEVFYDPQHPYTWGLLGSIARVDRDRPRRLPAIPGAPPSPTDKPEGCDFRPRCPYEFEPCPRTPGLERRGGGTAGHRDRCWLDPLDKREARVVDGQIGLGAGEKGPG